MQETMKYLCENIQGCVLGYHNSDEITLILIDYKNLNTDAWFNYEVQKVCSISASMATMAFNKFFELEYCKWKERTFAIDYLGHIVKKLTDEDFNLSEAYISALNKGAMFDSRCFNIPKEEVNNLLYWRQSDAIRNSVQMVGQKYFSSEQLHDKSNEQIKEMLIKEEKDNWDNYPIHKQRGSCCIKGINIESPEKSKWEINLNIPLFKDDKNYINDLIYVGD